MKFLVLIPFLSFSVFARTSAPATPDSLSSLMGALSQVIQDKTKVPGKAEAPAKLTPPGESTYKALENDLEPCQTSKKNEPQAVVIQKDGVSLQFKKFDLRIYGDQCPLDLTASLTATDQTEEKIIADFLVQVVFKKQSYIEKFKLKSVQINGQLAAEAQKEGTVVKIPVQVNLSGQGESTEIGSFTQKIGMSLLLDVNLAQFSFNMLNEQTASLHYQDVNKNGYSRVKMSGFSQPESTYKINDQAVSESEFQLFMQSFTLPGMISDEDPNSPDSRVLAQCSFVAFDKNSISSENLKSQLSSGKLQTEGRLAQGQSCMKDLQIPFKSKDSQDYTGALKFGTEWISFNGVHATNTQLNSSVFVLYGDLAPQTVESEDLVLGLKCQPAPACQ